MARAYETLDRDTYELGVARENETRAEIARLTAERDALKTRAENAEDCTENAQLREHVRRLREGAVRVSEDPNDLGAPCWCNTAGHTAACRGMRAVWLETADA